MLAEEKPIQYTCEMAYQEPQLDIESKYIFNKGRNQNAGTKLYL